ncbi:hypothetical protein J7F03_00165 [Streptomyces sp. ISL-43]|uniref:hypothetical protein n=1 Tax=Streptomyces sp. ISL-43 TaxID=2819183 RepID=UPI001BE9D10F|nr:hypothetical protein [Streptomyces sp. ISL-43]MBT2445537.1 hypothetical protein [Streptomyces sp. ISL-43]
MNRDTGRVGLLGAARHLPDPAPVTAADHAAWATRDSAAGALREFLLLPLADLADTWRKFLD